MCLRASAAGYVLQTHLSVRQQPALLVLDVDLPELLRATLIESDRSYEHAAGCRRAQEVRRVGQSHGDHVLRAHRRTGADTGRALDRRRVDAAVHDTPGRVVVGTQFDVSRHGGGGDLIGELTIYDTYACPGPRARRAKTPLPKRD